MPSESDAETIINSWDFDAEQAAKDKAAIDSQIVEIDKMRVLLKAATTLEQLVSIVEKEKRIFSFRDYMRGNLTKDKQSLSDRLFELSQSLTKASKRKEKIEVKLRFWSLTFKSILNAK